MMRTKLFKTYIMIALVACPVFHKSAQAQYLIMEPAEIVNNECKPVYELNITKKIPVLANMLYESNTNEGLQGKLIYQVPKSRYCILEYVTIVVNGQTTNDQNINRDKVRFYLHFAEGQTAEDADWLIGDEIMGPDLYGESTTVSVSKNIRINVPPGSKIYIDPNEFKQYFKNGKFTIEARISGSEYTIQPKTNF